MSTATGAKRKVLAHFEVYRFSAGTEFQFTLVACNSLTAGDDPGAVWCSIHSPQNGWEPTFLIQLRNTEDRSTSSGCVQWHCDDFSLLHYHLILVLPDISAAKEASQTYLPPLPALAGVSQPLTAAAMRRGNMKDAKSRKATSAFKGWSSGFSLMWFLPDQGLPPFLTGEHEKHLCHCLLCRAPPYNYPPSQQTPCVLRAPAHWHNYSANVTDRLCNKHSTTEICSACINFTTL